MHCFSVEVATAVSLYTILHTTLFCKSIDYVQVGLDYLTYIITQLLADHRVMLISTLFFSQGYLIICYPNFIFHSNFLYATVAHLDVGVKLVLVGHSCIRTLPHGSIVLVVYFVKNTNHITQLCYPCMSFMSLYIFMYSYILLLLNLINI